VLVNIVKLVEKEENQNLWYCCDIQQYYHNTTYTQSAPNARLTYIHCVHKTCSIKINSTITTTLLCVYLRRVIVQLDTKIDHNREGQQRGQQDGTHLVLV
jgi:hypothetical protein